MYSASGGATKRITAGVRAAADRRCQVSIRGWPSASRSSQSRTKKECCFWSRAAFTSHGRLRCLEACCRSRISTQYCATLPPRLSPLSDLPPGMDCDDFREAPETIATVERQLHVISEAAVRLRAMPKATALDRRGETFEASATGIRKGMGGTVVSRLETGPDRLATVESRSARCAGCPKRRDRLKADESMRCHIPYLLSATLAGYKRHVGELPTPGGSRATLL